MKSQNPRIKRWFRAIADDTPERVIFFRHNVDVVENDWFPVPGRIFMKNSEWAEQNLFVELLYGDFEGFQKTSGVPERWAVVANSPWKIDFSFVDKCRNTPDSHLDVVARIEVDQWRPWYSDYRGVLYEVYVSQYFSPNIFTKINELAFHFLSKYLKAKKHHPLENFVSFCIF